MTSGNEHMAHCLVPTLMVEPLVEYNSFQVSMHEETSALNQRGERRQVNQKPEIEVKYKGS